MKRICLIAALCLITVAGYSQENTTATAGQNGNAVIETIMARRSIRKYTDAKVKRETLLKIVQCGINAPSGMNAQPWEVRIVDDPEYINGVTEVYKAANPEQVSRDPDFKNMFRNAKAIICIGTPDNGSGLIDAGLMAENMILAAQSLGLGTCCLGGPVRFMVSDPGAAPYYKKLGFSKGYTLSLILAVGYPDESPKAKPRDAFKVKFVE